MSLDNTFALWYTPTMEQIFEGNERDAVTMINVVMDYPNLVEQCLGKRYATPNDLVVVKSGKAYALLEILLNGELTIYSQDRIMQRHKEGILYAIRFSQERMAIQPS